MTPFDLFVSNTRHQLDLLMDKTDVSNIEIAKLSIIEAALQNDYSDVNHYSIVLEDLLEKNRK